MLPVIVIIGRPNVGKSTLFNCLTRTRDALVADQPGVTRDRLYGQGKVGDKPYLIVDTGGLATANDGIEALMIKQSKQAIADADHILFLVEARTGLTAADQTIAQLLRQSGKSVTLVINKAEGLAESAACAEFYALGLGEPQAIAAAHNRGVEELITTVLSRLENKAEILLESAAQNAIRIAVVGRPNVGKSTLINRMLGEERVVVYDQPGTTRDSIAVPFTRREQNYILIDTAGVRRRKQVHEVIEKFSVIKTLQAIESAQVAIMVIDAQETITEQDLHLLDFILEAGKCLVIAVNKWDGLEVDQREKVRSDLERRLTFVDFAEIKFISALHGTGVGELFPLIDAAHRSASQEMSTSELTRILEEAISTHQPPMVHGRRVKLRYAHAGGHNPPLIVIHGKQTKSLPGSYSRYLQSFYRKALRLVGTPIRIVFRDAENPYN
jgi:GTPase